MSSILKKEIFYSEDLSHLDCYAISIGESLAVYCVHFVDECNMLGAEDYDDTAMHKGANCLPVDTV